MGSGGVGSGGAGREMRGGEGVGRYHIAMSLMK